VYYCISFDGLLYKSLNGPTAYKPFPCLELCCIGKMCIPECFAVPLGAMKQLKLSLVCWQKKSPQNLEIYQTCFLLATNMLIPTKDYRNAVDT